MKILRHPVTMVIAAGILLISFFAPVVSERTHHCNHCGSTKTELSIFGFTARRAYSESELERYITANHPERLSHSWKFATGSERTIFGSIVTLSSGRPNALYPIGHTLLDRILRHLTDDEVLGLIDALRADDPSSIEGMLENLLILASEREHSKEV